MALKKSVKSIMNGLVVPILIVDPEMKVAYVNAAAMARFPDAKTGVSLSELIESVRCLTATQRILDGDPEIQVKIMIQEVVPTSFRVNVARMTADSDKESIHAILSFEDISHIQEAEQMRHDFVANVSHELRSPLTSLVGFIETLQGPARDDVAAHERFLGMMGKEADRMARLINDLLSLSKLQARERIKPSDCVNIKDVITGIVTSIGGHDDNVRTRIKVDVPDAYAKVIGDVDELTQVFQNLIENGLKYSDNSTDVMVSSCIKGKAKGHICICIQDFGDGIDPIHIPRLTERFYRIDKGRSRAMGGTGLGLAIVKHILIRHRGWLKVKSELEKGSIFSVFLPAA